MTRQYIIKGRVQGVAYRYYTKQYADRLGLFGSVKNLGDGAVEVFASGSQALLDEFEKCLEKGSPYSLVESLDSHEVDFINFKEFRIII